MAGNQWQLIRTERAALVSDLESVPDSQWSTPSLCALWTVRDVLADRLLEGRPRWLRAFIADCPLGWRYPQPGRQG